jgi:hypothetical protein
MDYSLLSKQQQQPMGLTASNFQFSNPSVAGGTLPSGFGAMPMTGVDYSMMGGIAPMGNMGFKMPGATGSYPGASSGMGGFGATPLAGSGFGFNMGTAQLGLDGLKTIGNLYGAYQANKLANEQFDFSKKFAEKNLTNQTQSYNDRMADTLNARGFTAGTSKEVTASEIERRKLTA